MNRFLRCVGPATQGLAAILLGRFQDGNSSQQKSLGSTTTSQEQRFCLVVYELVDCAIKKQVGKRRFSTSIIAKVRRTSATRLIPLFIDTTALHYE